MRWRTESENGEKNWDCPRKNWPKNAASPGRPSMPLKITSTTRRYPWPSIWPGNCSLLSMNYFCRRRKFRRQYSESIRNITSLFYPLCCRQATISSMIQNGVIYMKRKLELYGTLGPADHSGEILHEMFQAGMTGLRLNLSHTNL